MNTFVWVRFRDAGGYQHWARTAICEQILETKMNDVISLGTSVPSQKYIRKVS